MPTQGFNVKKLKHKGIQITLWDLGGQKAIRPYWQNYYSNTNTIMFVIDSSDERRIEEAGLELNELLKNKKLSNVSLLVIANKQDLKNALTPKDIADKLLLNSIRDRPWTIQPCSAKSGQGLKDALMWAMQFYKK